MWDTDILNLSSNLNSIYTSTAYGEIRFYDKLSKVKKAISNSKISDKKINCMEKSLCENYLIIGDTIGTISMIDRRKDLKLLKTLKGHVGSIRDIKVLTKNIIASCSLDRCLNVFDYKTNITLSHMYLKTKLNCIYPYSISSSFKEDEVDEEEDEGEVDEGEEDDYDEEEYYDDDDNWNNDLN